MKQTLFGLLFIVCFTSSCTTTEEGFVGDWEGTTERVNDSGDLIKVDISCKISNGSGMNKNISLFVGGKTYNFDAQDDLNQLVYKDKALNSDSIIITYISGTAEILNDTLLHFDHKLYALKNNALLNSKKEMLDMVRK